jgi:glycosyltransferase involved in cell wall biosynthesis
MKLVIHNGSKVWGGNEKWLATLAVGLMERGHEVVVSCRRGGVVAAELEARGVPSIAARPRGALDPVSALDFARSLRAVRPGALLLTSWNRTFWGGWAGRATGVPRVVVRLGIVRPLPRQRPVTYAFRHFVDAMIVNSPTIRDVWLRSAPWYPAARIHVVLNGIAVPQIDRRVAGARLRSELGVPAEAGLVAVVGHVAYRKGFDVLVDALAQPEAQALHGVFVGDGPERAGLEERAHAKGVAGRTHWLGHRTDVLRLVAGADVFALCSRNEGMANVMLEAMAVGTPVVATDISGVREAIGPRPAGPEAGWIIPQDDPVALARALASVLSQQIGAGAPQPRVDEALRRIREEFGVGRMVQEAEAILFA